MRLASLLPLLADAACEPSAAWPAVSRPGPRVKFVDAASGLDVAPVGATIVSGPSGCVDMTANPSSLSDLMAFPAGAWRLQVSASGYAPLDTTVVTAVRAGARCGWRQVDLGNVTFRLRRP